MAVLSDRDAEELLSEYEAEIFSQVRQFTGRVRRHPWLDRDDLVTIGQLAVVEAVMSYTNRGTMLSTWVSKLIKWRIQEALELPEDRAAAYHVSTYAERHKDADGSLSEELLHELETIREDYRQLKSKIYQTISIDSAVSEDGSVGYFIVETIAGPGDSPEDTLIAKEEIELLRRAIESAPIDFRAKLIFSAEMVGTSNSALARELGLTRQRVDQIRKLGFEGLCEEAEVHAAALLPSDTHFIGDFEFQLAG